MTHSLYGEVLIYEDGQQLSITPAEILAQPKVFDRNQGINGKITISNGHGNKLTPELYALKDLVLAGEGDHKFSAPLQALFWGYLDGKYNERDNPISSYQGIHRSTISRYAKSGEIKSYQIGNRRLFKSDDVWSFFENQVALECVSGREAI